MTRREPHRLPEPGGALGEAEYRAVHARGMMHPVAGCHTIGADVS